jgi:hypothetical protein
MGVRAQTRIAVVSAIRLALAAVALALSPGAVLACESGPGTCIGSMTELSRVAADPRGGFVALGSVPAADGPDERDAIVLLGPDLSVVGDPVPIVADLTGIDTETVGARDLAVLPDGRIVVVGSAFGRGTEGATWQGWFALLSRQGQMLAFRPLPNPSRSQQILYRVRVLSDGRVIAVGRSQAGPHDPGCHAPSVGLLGWFDLDTLTVRSETLGVTPRAGRMAIYDVAEVARDGTLLLTGFESRWDDEDQTRCSDDGIVIATDLNGTVRQDGVVRFGDGFAGDVAFGIAAGPTLDSGAVAVGRTYAPVNQPLAARLAATEAGALSVADIGTLVTGGTEDRYAAVVPLLESGALAVGFRDGPDGREALWTALTGNGLEGQSTTGPVGSELSDVAAVSDGTVLAVGARTAPDLRRTGWVIRLSPGDLGGSPAIASSDTAPPLPALSEALAAGAIIARPEPQRLLAEALRKAERLTVPIELSEGTGVEIAAIPIGGDIDLSLLDPEGRLVDFSINAGTAAELVVSRLAPGRYQAVIDAGTDVAHVLISVRSTGEDGPDVSAARDARPAADAFRAVGYNVPGHAEAAAGLALRRAFDASELASRITGRPRVVVPDDERPTDAAVPLDTLLRQPFGRGLLNILRPVDQRPFLVEPGILRDAEFFAVADPERSRQEAHALAAELLAGDAGEPAATAGRNETVATRLMDAAIETYIRAHAGARASAGNVIAPPPLDAIIRRDHRDRPAAAACLRDDTFLRLAVTQAEGVVAYLSLLQRAYGSAEMFTDPDLFALGWDWRDGGEGEGVASPPSLRLDGLLRSPLFPVVEDRLVALFKRFEPAWQARLAEGARAYLAYLVLMRDRAASTAAGRGGDDHDGGIPPNPFGCPGLPHQFEVVFDCGSRSCRVPLRDLDWAVSRFWERRMAAGTAQAVETFLIRLAAELAPAPLEAAPFRAAVERGAERP